MDILVAVLLYILVSFLWSHLALKRLKRNYLHKQSNRTPLSNEEFCHRVGLEPSNADVVHAIRQQLAKDGGCDPLRIYPDDHFVHDFGWSYGEWEMLEDDYFPWGPSNIGEFLSEVAKRRKEGEQQVGSCSEIQELDESTESPEERHERIFIEKGFKRGSVSKKGN